MKRSAWLMSVMGWLAFAGCERPVEPTKVVEAHVPMDLVLPTEGIYTGAYIDFGDREDNVTLEGIEGFEKLVGKHQAIVASSSYWGEQTFPLANMQLIKRHGSIPLVFWSPWDRPYVEGLGPDRYSLTRIIAGEHDAYIDRWADEARAFGWPIIVSFANEANGAWFPWSGVLYGGDEPLLDSNGKPFTPARYKGPETFKKAWRHIVDRVRARGATNIQWVLHLMNYSMPMDSWNMAPQYYPGSDYCDWLGISLYGSQFPSDAEWAPFRPLFDWPYTELSGLDPTKPIMLCEWGAAHLPNLGDKAEWTRDAFRLLKDPKYSRLKAIVYWHERWQNSEGTDAGKYSNLRVNATPEILQAYRKGVGDKFYLGEPILKPKPSF